MDFQDLELLLQKSFGKKDLQVVDYTVMKLFPAGENFGSIMVRIDAKIRKDKNVEEEMLHLVGKTPSCTEEPILDWPLIFEKERFMYAELFPMYRELEKETGIDDKNLIDILPNFIGCRNSLAENAVPDENSVLLMENMMIKGFYNVDKQTGMDVHHARRALESLARYHAFGILMKQKRSPFAKKVIEQAQILGVDFTQVNKAHADGYAMLAKIPSLKNHLAVIEWSLGQLKNGANWSSIPDEPWATIIHGDFWTSNILFHEDYEGNVDDVKFVDFQGYLYNSRQKDITFFFGSSLDVETQTNHLEDLLNLYYDVFIKTLQLMDCDVSPFTRESFDAELKRQAVIEFLLNALAHQIFISEVNKDKDNQESKSNEKSKSNEESTVEFPNVRPNHPYIDKWLWLVEVYERMN